MDTRSGDTFEMDKAQAGATEKLRADLLGGKAAMSGATAAKVGFRELTEAESDLVRACRDAGKTLEDLLKRFDESKVDIDKRWQSIARTHFQEGLMAAVRSVTRPAFF